MVKVNNKSTELCGVDTENLLPVTPQIFDERVKLAMDSLQAQDTQDLLELSTILQKNHQLSQTYGGDKFNTPKIIKNS